MKHLRRWISVEALSGNSYNLSPGSLRTTSPFQSKCTIFKLYPVPIKQAVHFSATMLIFITQTHTMEVGAGINTSSIMFSYLFHNFIFLNIYIVELTL